MLILCHPKETFGMFPLAAKNKEDLKKSVCEKDICPCQTARGKCSAEFLMIIALRQKAEAQNGEISPKSTWSTLPARPEQLPSQLVTIPRC